MRWRMAPLMLVLLTSMGKELAAQDSSTDASPASPVALPDGTSDCCTLPSGAVVCNSCCGGGNGNNNDPNRPIFPTDSNAALNSAYARHFTGVPVALPGWLVSEPAVDLWLADTPLKYRTSRGAPVSFSLYYKNRHGSQNDVDNGQSAIFSLGYHCHAPWRSYVEAIPGQSTNFWVYVGDGTARQYTLGNVDYLKLATLTQISSTNVLQFRDGSTNEYGLTTTIGGVTRYFLTKQADPQGNAFTFQYLETNNTIVLSSVTDVDNRTLTFQYATAGIYSNVITKVIGPYGLTNSLQYDSSGRLTNLTDVINLTSSMQYDSTSNLTALITPYGTNKFSYFSISNQMYAVQVTELDVRKHLYLFYSLVEGGKVPSNYSSYVPSTTNASYFSMANTFDTTNTDHRNTFYWNPRQYAQLSDEVRTNLDNGSFNVSNLTSGDYLKGRQAHWLKTSDGTQTGTSLSLLRDPSPDGALQGQIKWLDYVNKTGGAADTEGTMFLPRYRAWKLPNGESRFRYSERNNLGYATNKIETYTAPDSTCQVRTNQFVYASNNIDLVKQVQLLGSTSRQVRSNVFNSAHLVLTNYDALNQMSTYSYNANQQLVTTVTPASLTRSNVYATSGTCSNFLTQAIDLEISGTNSYSYTNGYVYTVTDPRSLTMTNSWDALGRLTQTSYPDGTSVSRTYNILDLVTVVDRINATNQYVYDGFRQRTQGIDPRNGTTIYSYCNCGSLDSMTDTSGKTTLFTYDLQGKLCTTSYPGTGSVTNNYNLMRQITNAIDSAGASVTNCYNNQGLVCVVSNAFGCVRLLTFDIEDHATSITDANSVNNQYTYDPFSRVTQRTDPNNQTETFSYSSLGLVAYTNQLGQYRNYQYDVAGRKIAQTNGNGEVIVYTYNAAGDVQALSDGKGQTTSWGYDQYGRVNSQTNAAGTQVLTYQYDANGRLTNRWSLAKGSTTYKYDLAGNLTNIVYPSSGSITMQYDSNNRLTNMVDAVGTTIFAHTDFGALLSEDGPWANDTVSYTYTTNRLRASLNLQQPNASAWVQTYTYDGAKRLSSVSSPVGTFGYLYDPSGHLQVGNVSLPNTSYITNTYDSLSRWTGTYLKNSAGTTLNSHAYTYDNASRRARQTRTAGDYVDYTYDAIGQLKSVAGKESGGSPSRSQEQFGYAYDAADNLNYRTNNALLQTFNVDNLNQLTTATRSGTLTVAGTTTSSATNVTVNSLTADRYADNSFSRTNLTLVSGNNTFTAAGKDNFGRQDSQSITANLPTTVTYTYDGNGNLTYDGNRAFDYDDENQLIRVTVTNNWKSEFTYDGKMRRRIRKEFSWQNSGWALSNEVYYVYDGNLVIQERDANNVPTVSYTRGRDLSASLERAGGIGGLLGRTDHSTITPQNAFYHTDGNGNVTMLINILQLAAAKYLYDPFGSTLSKVGPLVDANVYRFSTKETHPASGLVYYLYRFYDSSLQRWPSRDPLLERGFEIKRKHSGAESARLRKRNVYGAVGPNLYWFVKNDPIRNNDAAGLMIDSQYEYYCRPICPKDPVCVAGCFNTYADRVDEIEDETLGCLAAVLVGCMEVEPASRSYCAGLGFVGCGIYAAGAEALALLDYWWCVDGCPCK